MKVAIYDPYLDTLGGGEKYVASVACFLEKSGHNVEFWWKKDFKNRINQRFFLNLNDSKFVDFVPTKANIIQRLLKTSEFDLLFWVSDGSLPTSLAKRTIIHMQIPAHWQGCATLANRIKAKNYTFLCNSRFTKLIIDRVYQIDSHVLYPPVDVALFTPLKKQNLIVSVGRFSRLLHSKRQDVLIQAFSNLHQILPGWKLILMGGSTDKDYIYDLKSLARNLPIEIIPNAKLHQVKKIMGQAKIFWTATGFGIDPKLDPEKAEHFGITVVEAMASGTVPMVVPVGGHLETINEEQNGIFWNSIEELVKKTLKLSKDSKYQSLLSKNAQESSRMYSIDRFERDLKKLL